MLCPSYTYHGINSLLSTFSAMKRIVYLLALLASVAAFKDYKGHQLIQYVPVTWDQVEALGRARRDLTNAVDFWAPPTKVGRPVTVAVTEPGLASLQQHTEGKNLSHTVVSRSLDKWLEQDLLQHIRTKEKNVKYGSDHHSEDFDLSQYHRYDEIMAFLHNLARDYPSIVSLFSLGASYEGRELLGIKIGNGSKGMWVDGGMHAREWASPAAALVLINRLVAEYSPDSEVTWHILPVGNPDGYEYTWDHERYWRKTRSQQCKAGENSSDCCFGVDPNRNWGYGFGGEGTSKDPCSEIYHGEKAFSEKETDAVAQYILFLRTHFGAYVSLHSFSELFLIPFGDREDHFPENFDEMLALAKKAEEAMEATNGVHYKVEQSSTLYPAAGASDDWAKGVAGIKYSYTIEVRPGEDEGGANLRGFSLRPEEILPTGEEVYQGLKVVAEAL